VEQGIYRVTEGIQEQGNYGSLTYQLVNPHMKSCEPKTSTFTGVIHL
jgi:hypothetical protein